MTKLKIVVFNYPSNVKYILHEELTKNGIDAKIIHDDCEENRTDQESITVLEVGRADIKEKAKNYIKVWAERLRYEISFW